MIGDRIGQIKTIMDIGAALWSKPPKFGQIECHILKNGNIDADQPDLWTWLIPLDGQRGGRAVRPLRFFFHFHIFSSSCPRCPLYLSLAPILARTAYPHVRALLSFSSPPPSRGRAWAIHPRADVAVGADADAVACARAPRMDFFRLFFISFSRSYLRLRAYGLGASFAANAGRPRFALVLARGALRLVPGQPRNPTGKL